MKPGWPFKQPQVAKTPAKAAPQLELTESEFMEWLRELAADPKWKHPTPWDEHTFRVGVQIALKGVSPPNDQAHAPATKNL
jgi:hypothetical protein